MEVATIKINDLVLKKAVCYVIIVLETEILSLRKGYTTELSWLCFVFVWRIKTTKLNLFPVFTRKEGGRGAQ